MNKGVALVGGVGLGAALMYLFDPDRGKRRRAQIRDKVEAAGNKVSDQAGKMGRDMRNRAYGMIAETRARLSHEEVTDDVLTNRVRARLGRMAEKIDALNVDATNGTVILRGTVLADQLPRVLRAVKYVRGVSRIENQFTVRQKGVSELQTTTPELLGAQ